METTDYFRLDSCEGVELVEMKRCGNYFFFLDECLDPFFYRASAGSIMSVDHMPKFERVRIRIQCGEVSDE